MRNRSCAAANFLVDLGVDRGETVALFTGTCPEWVYFWLGAARVGAVPAAVNDRQPRLTEVADSVDTLRSIVLESDSLTAALISTSTEPQDIAVFFTSGTTGPSKAVAT